MKGEDSLKSEMEKPTTTVISPDVPPEGATAVRRFFLSSSTIDDVAEAEAYNSSKDFFSEMLRGILKVDRLTRGSVSCSFTAAPFVCNFYSGLHGGAVASIAERVCFACARTVVSADKPLFLGELATSYLSSAPKMEEVTVEGSVVRSGRNLTVAACEFKIKKTGKLVYTARATFYHMPASKL